MERVVDEFTADYNVEGECLIGVRADCKNGLILEALSVFKRNVALHFEGVVECAICYS